MSHIVGTVQPVAPPTVIGPDSGQAPNPANTWAINFQHQAAPLGTKFLILHFIAADLPANNRLEVDLGYDMDVFTSADGSDFWTRPINIHAFAGQLVPIRYIANGALTGSVQLDQYGRGERHTKDPTNPSAAFNSFSNCDPFLGDSPYVEPDYATFWLCNGVPPNWENMACTTAAGDIRSSVATRVGMVVHVDFIATVGFVLSTCTVTLISPDTVITAGHCMADPIEDGKSSSITFDYMTNCDGTRPAGYNAKFFKVIQVTHQRFADGSDNDYCLMKLKVPAGGLGIAPITQRTSLPSVGEQIFGIHHPNGAVKKLSVPHPAFSTVVARSSSGITVDLDVAGGSSGSGLFDSFGQIVGVLSNGDACSLSYFPTFSILQDIAAPPSVTRDVMVVFDRSGSMSLPGSSGVPKIEEARAAASLFVQLVQAGTGNRLGLVSFSTTASSPVDFSLSPVTAATKSALIGASPFNGGIVSALTPGGSTTIGGGLNAAYGQLPAVANPRNVLLLTDGLQNTPPLVDPTDASPPNITLDVIGYGTPANLDGAMLTQLAEVHKGQYVLADSNLKLQKFFALAFGNIFEAGLLMDPEFDLPQGQLQSAPVPFQVCEEETLTIVVGWQGPPGRLMIAAISPLGVSVNAGSVGVSSSAAPTWTFLKIPLPLNGERDGTWNIVVSRAESRAGEASAATPALHYFISVVASGGALLRRMQNRTTYYTGDAINPRVGLQYIKGGLPPNAKLKVTISRPNVSVGNLLSQARLGPASSVDADIIPPQQATLMAIERQTGKPAVGYDQLTVPLFDDILNTNSPEPAGIFGNVLKDLLTVEGNYTFHCQATYGEGCVATRELMWTVHVIAGIDAKQTTLKSNLSHGVGTLTITPKDPSGNHIGPGQYGNFTVSAAPGTTITGPPTDNCDGSYTVPITWNSSLSPVPGVIFNQPDRPSTVVTAGGSSPGVSTINWQMLFWISLLIAIIFIVLWIIK